MKILMVHFSFAFFAALMVAVALTLALYSADQSQHNALLSGVMLLIYSRQNFSVSALIRQAKLYARKAREDTLEIVSLLGDKEVEQKVSEQISALDQDISIENIEHFWALLSSALVSFIAIVLIVYSIMR
jgi:hypothetical protein